MAMFPHERSLVSKYSDAPFALIGVNNDKDRAATKKLIKSKNLNWRSFWEGRAEKISKQWNINGWPTIIYIDHKGIIRYRDNKVDDDLLESLVQQAKAEKK